VRHLQRDGDPVLMDILQVTAADLTAQQQQQDAGAANSGASDGSNSNGNGNSRKRTLDDGDAGTSASMLTMEFSVS
jgi:hypothetical protein